MFSECVGTVRPNVCPPPGVSRTVKLQEINKKKKKRPYYCERTLAAPATLCTFVMWIYKHLYIMTFIVRVDAKSFVPYLVSQYRT